MTVPLRNKRYNRLQGDDEEEEVEIEESHNRVSSEDHNLLSSDSPDMCLHTSIINENTLPLQDNITVCVLDSVQNKFQIACPKTMTISEFKIHSSNIHHVPPSSQRLVYMGRLLSDDETLEDAKIDNDNIIHLFPKPNIVITQNDGEEEDAESTTQNSSGSDEQRAHIPQIVLDIDEARRNQSMSVLLTSSEMFEAQHRVKLLAFLLLIICSMELLTLLTIMLGVPQQDDTDIPPGDPTDIPFSSNPATSNQVEMREWRNSDYFDLLISTFGFYVATLGIKATTDNTLRTAKRYYVGLIMTGLAWIGYYYYINVDDARQREQQSHTSTIDDSNSTSTDYSNNDDPDTNIYMEGFYGIMFPIFIWTMCFVRAWQFQTLIAEAEREMQSRFDDLLGQQRERDEDLRLQVENEGIV